MPDDPEKTALDRKLIALTEEHEVRAWCKSLGCTESQLRKAVDAVGHSADKVREYMKVHRPVIGERRRVPARKTSSQRADPRPAPIEPGQEIASPSHDQWLLDEALAETFPASDPISPSTTTRTGQ